MKCVVFDLSVIYVFFCEFVNIVKGLVFWFGVFLIIYLLIMLIYDWNVVLGVIIIKVWFGFWVSICRVNVIVVLFVLGMEKFVLLFKESKWDKFFIWKCLRFCL